MKALFYNLAGMACFVMISFVVLKQGEPSIIEIAPRNAEIVLWVAMMLACDALAEVNDLKAEIKRSSGGKQR